MHNFLTTKLIALGTLLLSPTMATGTEAYVLPVSDMFVPRGFDDNDNAQVVVDGWAENSCDIILPPKVEVDDYNKTIVVTPQAQKGIVECLPVLTRYTATADLGLLPYGHYEIVTNNGWLVQDMEILEATNSGPDEFPFAKINEAHIDYAPDKENNGKMSIVLQGEFINSCQSWEDIEVEAQDDRKVFVISPKIKISDVECLDVIEKFTVRVPLDTSVEATRYLSHIRTDKGEAINLVFSGIPD